MRRLVLILLFAVLGPGQVTAQADTGPSRQYSLHDGLPSKHITALAQTDNGLLWIGTKHGLVIFDGHEFRPLPMPDSVGQKRVLALTPMPDGSVWAGVGHDAVRMRPHGAIQSYALDSHDVVDILRRDGRVTIVTNLAVWTQHPDRDALSRTRLRYETLSDVTLVRGADLGPQGRLWIVNTKQGPGRVRTDGRVDFADPPPSPPSEYPRNEDFFDLRFSSDGTALVARGTHLYRFDPGPNTFRVIRSGSESIGDIHRQGRTAYITGGSYVLRYDTQTGTFRAPIGRRQGLPDARPTEILRGREGGLWIGSEGAGLAHLPAPNARHVRSIDGHDLQYGAGFWAGNGAVWVNTWGDGLFQLRPQRRRVTPDGHTRWVFLRSHDGQLHGLTPSSSARGRNWYRWSPADGWRFVAFAKHAVRGYVDRGGTGYFWHNQGLYRHVPMGDTTARTRLRPWPLGESQHHLMGPAPNGDLVLFDQGTVLRLRRPDGAVLDTMAQVPEYATSGGRRLTVDASGRIWTPFNSLLRLAPQEGTTQPLLEDAAIENVGLAGDSLAMAKSNEGLYLLDARTGAVRRHLTSGDGLLSNDINGALMTKDTLYVGHKSGLSLLPTSALFDRPPRPHAVLTGLEVNFDERSPTAAAEWAPEERTVGFSYTGASLTHPDRVQYEVRLLPRDSTWKSTDRRFARYTDLAPDEYQFEVRAHMEGHPPGPAATYTFTIPPHFYETRWFRLLAVFGIFGLIVGAYRWRIRRLQQRQNELETAVEERTQELARAKEKTEQQAERLQELDEAKNRFFAHVSHEFRTPLSLILSPLRDALQRTTEGAASFSEHQLRRMTHNAERLQRLIDQLLDLATLEAGGMELDRRPGDLAVLVERTAEAFRSKAEQKNIALETEMPPERVEMCFDPEKVETIVSNLVGNAVKFTPEGGRVVLRLRLTEDAPSNSAADTPVEGGVRISVADTGPGIDPAQQDRIFDQFERPGSDTTTAHEGTGLGLALTSELVEMHGGTIEVESTPGAGAEFIVHLPRVPVDTSPTGAPDRESANEPSDRTGTTLPLPDTAPPRHKGNGASPPPSDKAASDEDAATILVVEDNAGMRAYLREQLSGRWTVRTASDGDEGWAAVQDETPDLVLSDVMMPNVDGIELCERIKDSEALRQTPVLLLTARAGTDAEIEGLKTGADDYVTKPFDAEELRQRITNHLAAREHLRDQYRTEVQVAPIETVVDEEDLPFVEEVVEAVEARLSDPDLTVSRLADAVALSRRQLTRRLKDAMGQTPAAFLRGRRIERAKELLANDPETIAEVAYAVGFRSPSAFSKTFREETGHTPSEYVEENGA